MPGSKGGFPRPKITVRAMIILVLICASVNCLMVIAKSNWMKLGMNAELANQKQFIICIVLNLIVACVWGLMLAMHWLVDVERHYRGQPPLPRRMSSQLIVPILPRIFFSFFIQASALLGFVVFVGDGSKAVASGLLIASVIGLGCTTWMAKRMRDRLSRGQG